MSLFIQIADMWSTISDQFTSLAIPTLVLIVTLVVLAITYSRYRPSNAPPYQWGWIPWLGVAVNFGKAPLDYIDKAQKEHGPVFTLLLAGKRMTFLTDSTDLQHFFNHENTDFQMAVKQPVRNTASISTDDFYRSHTKIHDTVKGCLAPALLPPMVQSLGKDFSQNILQWGEEGNGELNSLVRTSMYKAVLDNLFGVKVLTNPDIYKHLEDHFVVFDDQFEYGSQLPEIFLSDWSTSKHWLLDLFRKVVKNIGEEKTPTNKQTLLETLVHAVNGRAAPNFSLLMMWASLANAIPVTFWTLAFLLSRPKMLSEFRGEIDSVLGSAKNDGSAPELTEEKLQRLVNIKAAILETIRLRSPGAIARGVKKAFNVKGYTIPKGDLLIISPYWTHRNPLLFPDPNEFKPSRWFECDTVDINKNIFLEGFVAFGGGRYQCPGRWFALMEIQIYIILVLYYYDLKLLDPVPKNSPLHLVGTQQPETNCRFAYTRRH